jgi:hypothetical protein
MEMTNHNLGWGKGMKPREASGEHRLKTPIYCLLTLHSRAIFQQLAVPEQHSCATLMLADSIFLSITSYYCLDSVPTAHYIRHQLRN